MGGDSAPSIIWHLFREAWILLYRGLGTTSLGYWLPILISVTVFAVGCVRNRRDFIHHIKSNILDGFIVAVTVWLLVYALYFCQAVRIFSNPPMETRTRPPRPPAPEPKPSSQPALLVRELSTAQKRKIVDSLSKYPGQKFTIDCAVNDPEAHRFGGELRDSLTKAGWQMLSYVPDWDDGFSSAGNWPNFFGVQWFERAGAPQIPAAAVLRHELRKCCGIIADGVAWPDTNGMENGVIYIWVGPNSKLLNP